jgi:hypothetical protein
MNDEQLQKSCNKLQLTRPVDVLPSLLGKEVAPAGDRYEDCKMMRTMHLQQRNQVREMEQQNLSRRKKMHLSRSGSRFRCRRKKPKRQAANHLL